MGRRNDSWTQAGVNEGGDPVYVKVAGGSEGSGAAATSSSQMTKKELQALAAERGLKTTGSKDELISRLGGIDV